MGFEVLSSKKLGKRKIWDKDQRAHKPNVLLIKWNVISEALSWLNENRILIESLVPDGFKIFR
jgi:hypothetical protein